jgi:integrase
MTIIATAAQVEVDRPPGVYRVANASGLYLQVSRTRTKSWIYRFQLGGKQREMGLGPIGKVSLADARKAATAAAALRDKGIDPIDARRAERAANLEANRADLPRSLSRANTFKYRAEAYIDVQAKAWRQQDSASYLWRNPFAKWVYPAIGDMEIADIRLSHVVQALAPAWHAVPDTAQRIRARMQRIFDAAIADGAYARPNPAQAALVMTQLPKRKRVIAHYPAATLKEAPAIFARIRAAQGTAYRAHEYMILTTARPGEALRARWSEIDLEEKLWTIPAERTKAAREHVVPLSEAAANVLAGQQEIRVNDYIFPGQRPDAPLSYDAFAVALRKIGITHVTPHSFRSTFRDWAGDIADVPRDLAEAQLAHALPATEGAYRRLTAVAKRRVMLANYAAWLFGASENVVAFLRREGAG